MFVVIKTETLRDARGEFLGDAYCYVESCHKTRAKAIAAAWKAAKELQEGEYEDGGVESTHRGSDTGPDDFNLIAVVVYEDKDLNTSMFEFVVVDCGEPDDL